MKQLPYLSSAELDGLPPGMKLWYGQGSNEAPSNVRKAMIHAMFAKPDSFLRICYIQTNEGEKALLQPTRAQMLVAQAYQDNSWIYVSKYRQAMISTVTAMLMLRDTMYGEAIKTAIVAQDRDTCDEIMDRIIYAFNNMPETMRNPLAKGTKPTERGLNLPTATASQPLLSGLNLRVWVSLVTVFISRKVVRWLMRPWQSCKKSYSPPLNLGPTQGLCLKPPRGRTARVCIDYG